MKLGVPRESFPGERRVAIVPAVAARVFVIGAGVAGRQAIASAQRLGARVEAYDVRPAVKEQIQSLGARVVEMSLDASDAHVQHLVQREKGPDGKPGRAARTVLDRADDITKEVLVTDGGAVIHPRVQQLQGTT